MSQEQLDNLALLNIEKDQCRYHLWENLGSLVVDFCQAVWKFEALSSFKNQTPHMHCFIC